MGEGNVRWVMDVSAMGCILGKFCKCLKYVRKHSKVNYLSHGGEVEIA